MFLKVKKDFPLYSDDGSLTNIGFFLLMSVISAGLALPIILL